MLIEHAHRPGDFDPGRCRGCARETGLLDHYDHAQRQQQALTQAHQWPTRPTARPSGPVVGPALGP